MTRSGTAWGMPELGRPDLEVRVIGADDARAEQLKAAVVADGLEAELVSPQTLREDLPDPRVPTLVALEGLESTLDGLHAIPPPAQLAALEPDTAASYRGMTVLPAYAPGAIRAWALAAAGRERSAALWDAYLDRDDEGVVVLDDRSQIVLINPGARELLGVPVAVGHRLPFAPPPPARSRVVTVGRGAFAASSVEITGVGTERVLVRLRAAEQGEGLEGDRAHRDRLVAVGALAAGFAHEVNNPAQAVTANLSELGEQLKRIEWAWEQTRGLVSDERKADFDDLEPSVPLAEGRQLIQECFDGLGRIAGIVRDLRSFSRLQPECIGWVHPNEVVNQACSIAHNHIRHRARLVKELAAVETFPGDRNKLVQVVTNLLVNAAQAMPLGAGPGNIWIKTGLDRGRVVISVADDGEGIPDAALKRIFEPFFTTKEESEGMGLGLALSLDIARQHGGTLEVDTRVGWGTRFDLILPLTNELSMPRPAIAERSPDIHQRGRILLVDDEPSILRALARLVGRNHEVITRDGGRSALALLAEDTRFDVILCDLMMPDVDGPALYDALYSREPELARKMVFMTGGAFAKRAQAFLERVQPRILDKPAPAVQLERAIQETLAMPEMTSELPNPAFAGPATRPLA